MRYLFIALFFGLASLTYAQEIPGKAQKLYQEGKSHMVLGATEEAIVAYQKAIDVCPGYGLARLTLGDIYFEKQEYSAALYVFTYEGDLLDQTSILLTYRRGVCHFALSNYELAKIHLETYTRSIDAGKRELMAAEQMLASIEVASELKAHPVAFDPLNMGAGINSPTGEYMPSISADGKTLIFTRLVQSPNRRKQEDFYYSEKTDQGWSVAKPVKGLLNTSDNEGAQTLTSDGFALFFTACNRREGMGSCDLYLSTNSNNGWTKPINLGAPINTGKWESQPSVSSDGKTIYFASNRPGGYGGKDLWKSEYQGGGKWSEPENLGPEINTDMDEFSPFIHFDNQTLYFASNGWPGMGNADLFMSKCSASGEWSEPINLGYPINTFGEQSGLFVAADGRTAFFASNDMEDGYGELDIYTFELPVEKAATEVAYFKGKIKDAETKVGISSEISVYDLTLGETVLETGSGNSGDYFLVLNADHDYALNIYKKSYLFHSENLSVDEDFLEGKAFIKDVFLSPIKPGVVMALENVFFDLDEASLKSSSHHELDRVAELLKINQDVKVEIGGHTDNSGDKSYNQNLSEQRAKAVYNYLISTGVNPERLVYKGYGDSLPRTNNDSAKGRAMNRRTEIKILQ